MVQCNVRTELQVGWECILVPNCAVLRNSLWIKMLIDVPECVLYVAESGP